MGSGTGCSIWDDLERLGRVCHTVERHAALVTEPLSVADRDVADMATHHYDCTRCDAQTRIAEPTSM